MLEGTDIYSLLNGVKVDLKKNKIVDSKVLDAVEQPTKEQFLVLVPDSSAQRLVPTDHPISKVLHLTRKAKKAKTERKMKKVKAKPIIADVKDLKVRFRPFGA